MRGRVGEGERRDGGADLDDLTETRDGCSVRKHGEEAVSTLAQAQALSCPRLFLFQSLFLSLFLSASFCLFGLNIHVIPPPFLHSSLPTRSLHTLMSPAALQQQYAAVLYGQKDLRVDARSLWPPQQGQAQVTVVSTGLCGSDRTFPSTVVPGRSLTHPSTQYTIISTAVTVILPSNRL
jgi:hypothetical protein